MTWLFQPHTLGAQQKRKTQEVKKPGCHRNPRECPSENQSTSREDYVRTHVRWEDFACRYDGEEFLIGLPETTLEDARERAEYLRDAVYHITIPYGGRCLGPITISPGVAALSGDTPLPEHGLSQNGLVRAADKALYLAKEQGRNRAVTADKSAEMKNSRPQI